MDALVLDPTVEAVIWLQTEEGGDKVDGQLPAGGPRTLLIGLPAAPIEPHNDQMIEESGVFQEENH